jgi:glycosyltransferase involved in cell wall biosynthesis
MTAVPSRRAAEPPRVGVFALSFLPYSQTFIYDELTHLARYRAEVFTALRRGEDRFPFPDVHAVAHEPAGSPAERAYRLTAWSPRFHRRLAEGGFSLLHAHFGWSAAYAMKHAGRLGLPLVVTFYGFDVPLLASPLRFRPDHWRYWLGSRRLFRQAARILAVSQDLVDRLVALGAPREKTVLKQIGVAIPAPRPAERAGGPWRVLMVGRFVEKKGFEDGIRALAQAVAAGRDARLEIAGDGPLQPAYEQLIRDLGLGERVRFLGPLRHQQVLDTMALADVLLLPSVTARNGDREGNPTVLKEAAAAGLPIVATRHAGIPETVDDGVSALLVDERDPAALADRLTRLLDDQALRARLGGAARDRMVRQYSIETVTARLERMYDEVVEARARR